MGIRVVPQKEILKKRYKKLKIDRKFILAGLILLILSFFIDVKKFVFIGLFMIANALLLSLDRYLNMPVDIEFSTFAAILVTRVYGLNWGIFTAISTKVAAMLYNANIRADHFFMIGGYCMAAFITSMFPGVGIVNIGLIATIIVNIYIYFVSKYITNLYPFEILMYGASNIIFNMVLFIAFSEPFLSLMSF